MEFGMDQIRAKIQAYCAYQERCHAEIRDKLYGWGLPTATVDQLCAELVNDNFLNEERFAQAYASGKFRMKRWGWRKIEAGLKSKKVSANCIKKARQEIDPDEYLAVLVQIMDQKAQKLKAKNGFERGNKLAHYLISRGYETDLVWDALRERGHV